MGEKYLERCQEEWRKGNMHKSLKEVEGKIRQILENRNRERKRKEEKRIQNEEKRNLRRILREWRKDKEGGGGEKYRKEKRDKKLREAKKKRKMTGGKEKSKE